MKMMRKAVCVLITLLLFAGTALASPVMTSAVIKDSDHPLKLQDYGLDDQGTVNMLAYSESGKLEKEGSFLSVAGFDVPLDSVDAFSGKSIWVILVDTATVSTKENSEPIRDTLKRLIDSMGASDTVCIVKTGDTASKKYDFKERDEYRDEDYKYLTELYSQFPLKPERSNMYQTMSVALDCLDKMAKKEGSGESGDVRTAMVVVSSGKTDNENGITYDELLNKIQTGKTVVYTLAYTKEDEENTDFAMFANVSPGGIGVEENDYDSKAKNAVKDIKNNEKKFFTVKTQLVQALNTALQGMAEANDPAGIDKAKNDLGAVTSLVLRDSAGNEVSANIDGAQWEAVKNKIIYPEPQPVVTEPPVNPKSFIEENLTYIIIGAAVLLAVILILVFSLRRRKPAPVAPVEPEGPPEKPIEHVVEKEEVREEKNVTEPDEWTVEIALTPLDDGGATIRKELVRGELSIGRQTDSPNERAQLQIRTKDGKMSRKHLLLRYRDGNLYAVDLSQNGTKVNGKMIDHPEVLHQEDEITMGRSSYKIMWRYK